MGEKGVIFVRRGRRAGNIAMTTNQSSGNTDLCKGPTERKGRRLGRAQSIYALRDGGCQESPMFQGSTRDDGDRMASMGFQDCLS